MADEAGVADLVAKFEAAGQGHVTQQLASLPPEQAQHLTAQLATIDPARVNALYQRATTYTPPDGGVLTPLSEMAPLEGTAEQGPHLIFAPMDDDSCIRAAAPGRGQSLLDPVQSLAGIESVPPH